jgi:glucose/arabinose dehydrogenase
MNKVRLLSAASLSFLSLIAADTKLPAPYATPSAANPPKVVAKPDGRTLQVPAGFAVEEFASGFQKPRYMLQLPTGAVLVTDSMPKGSVFALVKGQPKKEVLSGLSKPFGMALWKDYLYVTEDESIKRYRFDAKEL